MYIYVCMYIYIYIFIYINMYIYIYLNIILISTSKVLACRKLRTPARADFLGHVHVYFSNHYG